jgi:hypothetical protein
MQKFVYEISMTGSGGLEYEPFYVVATDMMSAVYKAHEIASGRKSRVVTGVQLKGAYHESN